MKTAAFSAAELRFGGWIPRAPDLSNFYAKGRGGLQPGASRDCRPPWGPPESRPRRWEFRTAKCESRLPRPEFATAKRESRPRCPDFFTAKCESRQRRSDFFTAKCESRLPRPDFFTAKRESRPRRPDFFTAKRKDDHAARTSSRRSAKADNGGRLCPDGAFSAARPAGTARFLITRGKASFYETATFGRRKVFFCSPFCGLLFCPARAGEKPAAPKPRPPRPTTATGSRFLRRQRERPPRRPRPSPPAREGSLGAPNDRTFPPGAERKARKEKGKEEPRMERAPPL